MPAKSKDSYGTVAALHDTQQWAKNRHQRAIQEVAVAQILSPCQSGTVQILSAYESAMHCLDHHYHDRPKRVVRGVVSQ